MSEMDREVALHFWDQLREARAIALKDTEAFEAVVFVIERIGVYLTGIVSFIPRHGNPDLSEEPRQVVLGSRSLFRAAR